MINLNRWCFVDPFNLEHRCQGSKNIFQLIFFPRDIMKSDFIKIGNQLHDMFFVWDQLAITSLLVSSNLTDY